MTLVLIPDISPVFIPSIPNSDTCIPVRWRNPTSASADDSSAVLNVT